MGLVERARTILRWKAKDAPADVPGASVPPVSPAADGLPLTDGAKADGPLVGVVSGEVVSLYHAKEARDFKVLIGGQAHEHVDTASDGMWVYAARPY